MVSRRLHEERTKKDRQCSGAPRSHQQARSRRMSCCCGGLKWLKCLPVNDAVPRVLRSAVEFNFLTEAVKSGWPPVL